MEETFYWKVVQMVEEREEREEERMIRLNTDWLIRSII